MSGRTEDAEPVRETPRRGPWGERKWAEYGAEEAKRRAFSSAGRTWWASPTRRTLDWVTLTLVIKCTWSPPQESGGAVEEWTAEESGESCVERGPSTRFGCEDKKREVGGQRIREGQGGPSPSGDLGKGTLREAGLKTQKKEAITEVFRLLESLYKDEIQGTDAALAFVKRRETSPTITVSAGKEEVWRGQ